MPRLPAAHQLPPQARKLDYHVLCGGADTELTYRLHVMTVDLSVLLRRWVHWGSSAAPALTGFDPLLTVRPAAVPWAVRLPCSFLPMQQLLAGLLKAEPLNRRKGVRLSDLARVYLEDLLDQVSIMAARVPGGPAGPGEHHGSTYMYMAALLQHPAPAWQPSCRPPGCQSAARPQQCQARYGLSFEIWI
jgi:hypothetical protein